MADPTLADVIERLDKLVELVGDLKQALAAQTAVAPATTPGHPVEAPPAPLPPPRQDEIPAPPPQVAAAFQSVAASAATMTTPAPRQPSAARGLAVPTGHWVEPLDDPDRWPLPPPESPLEHTIAAVFEAALLPDAEDCFEYLQALTHPRAFVGPHSLDHLRAFTWKKLRQVTDRFIDGDNPASFRIQRTVPGQITRDATSVKVFLRSNARATSPAPIYLERDDAAGGAWRVYQISF